MSKTKATKTPKENWTSSKRPVNDLGFITKTETIEIPPSAFLGSIPGNCHHNPVDPILSTRNFSHLITLSTPWEGTYTNEHLKTLLDGSGEAPHIICKSTNAPFFLNLNYGDVGHTLIIGPKGSGKSTLLSALAIFWLKYPRARVIFFDKDASSFHACNNAGGTFIDISDDPKALKINPFGILGTKDNPNKPEQVFVSQLIQDHFTMSGVPISPKDRQTIFEAVENMATAKPELRSWSTFFATTFKILKFEPLSILS